MPFTSAAHLSCGGKWRSTWEPGDALCDVAAEAGPQPIKACLSVPAHVAVHHPGRGSHGPRTRIVPGRKGGRVPQAFAEINCGAVSTSAVSPPCRSHSGPLCQSGGRGWRWLQAAWARSSAGLWALPGCSSRGATGQPSRKLPEAAVPMPVGGAGLHNSGVRRSACPYLDPPLPRKRRPSSW